MKYKDDPALAGLMGQLMGCAFMDMGSDSEEIFEEVVLERASTDTVARTRTLARAIAEELHPESITVRHARAERVLDQLSRTRGVGVR